MAMGLRAGRIDAATVEHMESDIGASGYEVCHSFLESLRDLETDHLGLNIPIFLDTIRTDISFSVHFTVSCCFFLN